MWKNMVSELVGDGWGVTNHYFIRKIYIRFGEYTNLARQQIHINDDYGHKYRIFVRITSEQVSSGVLFVKIRRVFILGFSQEFVWRQ